ncbi:hypothetical protein BMS3Abin12_00725 [bacterium BMS3Abin12]|nr:hypothetical protein BMS3Abin12_00725 [bacterium BMS3Abin12]
MGGRIRCAARPLRRAPDEEVRNGAGRKAKWRLGRPFSHSPLIRCF